MIRSSAPGSSFQRSGSTSLTHLWSTFWKTGTSLSCQHPELYGRLLRHHWALDTNLTARLYKPKPASKATDQSQLLSVSSVPALVDEQSNQPLQQQGPQALTTVVTVVAVSTSRKEVEWWAVAYRHDSRLLVMVIGNVSSHVGLMMSRNRQARACSQI